MAACDQVKLLLGPFDDGELEPHEMEDVALHVVSCGPCKTALDDYRRLGVALRDCLPQPTLDGFSAAVVKRIGEVPQPWWSRWRSFVDALGDRIGSTVPLVAAGAITAILTVWLATPYVDHLLHRPSNPSQMASNKLSDSTTATLPTAGVRQASSPDQPGPSIVALSNDPSTTVIWLPSQP